MARMGVLIGENHVCKRCILQYKSFSPLPRMLQPFLAGRLLSYHLMLASTSATPSTSS